MATETAEQTAEKPATKHNVTIEDAGASLKRVTIEVSASVVDEKIKSSFDTLSSQVVLPGFRAGKAPKALVERRFGKGVRDEVRGELIQEAVQSAIEEHKLKTIGRPALKDAASIELQPGKPLNFSFEVEVAPEFDLPGLEGIEIVRPTLEVSDEMIETEIENQTKRAGRLDDVEGEAEADDLYFGAVEVRNEADEVVAKAPETVSRLPKADEDGGAGSVGGIRIENLHKLLKPRKPGETFEFETVGPENHEIDAIRGEKIKLSFRIDRVAKLIPATIQELIERFGLADENELRERVKEALTARIVYEQQDAMRRQVAKYLQEQVTLDLPAQASAAQAQRTLEAMRMRLLQRGAPEYLIEERIAELREASAEQAARELKIFFIMERIADELDVEVTEREVNSRIATIAREQGVRPEQLRQQLIQSGRAGLLFSQVRHEKAADAVIARATIKEVSADEWNRMMESEDKTTSDESGEGEGSAATKKKTTTKKKTSKKSGSKKDATAGQ